MKAQSSETWNMSHSDLIRIGVSDALLTTTIKIMKIPHAMIPVTWWVYIPEQSNLFQILQNMTSEATALLIMGRAMTCTLTDWTVLWQPEWFRDWSHGFIAESRENDCPKTQGWDSLQHLPLRELSSPCWYFSPICNIPMSQFAKYYGTYQIFRIPKKKYLLHRASLASHFVDAVAYCPTVHLVKRYEKYVENYIFDSAMPRTA